MTAAAKFVPSDILTDEQLIRFYGDLYRRGERRNLDRTRVPSQYWPLLPYASFWGVADDWARQSLVDDAPAPIKANLKRVVSAFDTALDDWLAGPEANGPSFSDEYIAFSALRMAADFA